MAKSKKSAPAKKSGGGKKRAPASPMRGAVGGQTQRPNSLRRIGHYLTRVMRAMGS